MRITGGVFRSRALVAPRGQETRPTSDRVREALFSMLASSGAFEGTPGPRVLDLYAGSGALALEAISRGASAATVVESGRAALASIGENIRALDVESQVSVLALRVDRALPRLEGLFDIILVDPPYAEVNSPSFRKTLGEAARRLENSGLFVLEHAATDEPEAPEGLIVDRRRRHGDTILSLFRRAEGP